MSRPGLLRAFAGAVTLGCAAVVISGCELGVEGGADYPVAYGGYPDACVATTEAIYYNGYPSYWCGGVWYFRGEGGRWGHYDREPPGLYSRRAQGAPMRRNYEPRSPGFSRPSGGGRPAGGRPGGGHR